jgi:hypothetical protein
MVDNLSSKHEALSSSPSAVKKKKKDEKSLGAKMTSEKWNHLASRATHLGTVM